jgi:hypothetical protein
MRESLTSGYRPVRDPSDITVLPSSKSLYPLPPVLTHVAEFLLKTDHHPFCTARPSPDDSKIHNSFTGGPQGCLSYLLCCFIVPVPADSSPSVPPVSPDSSCPGKMCVLPRLVWYKPGTNFPRSAP